jgi:4-amino-4-deoxy-L-arabinose transferase-like glycosyltransferase
MLGNYYYILILLLLSLFLNLGIYPLFLEEPRRAVVALEMSLSGNYIVPTIMGELYFAKPPLFNWILILSSKFLGSFSEFSVRLPTVISLILIGIFNYLFIKKYLKEEIAFFSSIFFITSGTIFYYFSLLGEIDIFYSLIIYLCIISVIFFFSKKELGKLYFFSFLFAGFGFLTKGFPSVVFLYGTLILVFFIGKKYRYFFSKFHLLGIFVFVLIVGTYFYLYNLYHPLVDYIQFLWSESSGRTVIGENKSLKLLTHLFVFPLKTLIALIPWSILVIFLFRKNFFQEVFKNPILKIFLVVFLGNYFVYWISPGANQRYIYMLYPFLILVFSYFYFTYREKELFKTKIFNGFAILFISLLTVFSLALPFLIKNFQTENSSIFYVALISIVSFSFLLWFFVYFAPKLPDKKIFYNSIISCLLLLLFFTFVVLIFKIPTLWLISFSFAFVFLIILAFAWKSNLKFVYLIISLIFFRILFDLVYLPVKSKSGDSYKEKINGIKVAKIAELYNQNLYYYGKDKLPHGLLFYIEKTKKEILKRNLTLNKNNLYLSKPEYMKGIKFYKLFQFEVKNKKYILFRPVE